MVVTAALLALTLAQTRPATPPKPAAATPAPGAAPAKPPASQPPKPATAAPAKPAATGAKPASTATPRIPPRPAAAPAPVATQAVTPAKAAPAEPALPRFGLALEASVPEGANLSFVYRPVTLVRVWAGPAWNYVAWGAQAGVGVALANWKVAPVVSIEGARFFGADVSFLKVPVEVEPLLADVTVNYGAIHLGLEMGSQRGFNFALRLGLSRVWVQAHGEARIVQDAGTPTESTVVFADPKFQAAAPSLKLGFNYWF